MEQYYRCVVKTSFEDAKGREKFRKESYIVSAISPTDVEAKMSKSLGTADYEVVGITLQGIVDVIS